MSEQTLRRLRALLADEGGLIAALLGAPAAAGAREASAHEHERFSPSSLLAGGPRTGARLAEYELLVEAIYEGYLLHYGRPRIVRSGEQNLALLAGDRLYAIGLARLVALGDTLAVSELADTITLCALARAAGDPALAQAVWAAGARAVGWGPSESHARAKQLVLAGAPGALDAMRTSAQIS